MGEKRIITQEELDNACLLHNKWNEENEGERAVFENCIFDRLNFAGKQFNGAIFRNCDFKLCDITDAGMCFAELKNISFTCCDCHLLIAEEAALRNIAFENCNLKSTIFTHSSLRNVQYHNCDRNDMSLERCYTLPEAEIVNISPKDLRNMSDKEGLILQGCGGDVQEWADGINTSLTDSEILLNGSMFSKLYVFETEGHTCIMFPFEDIDLNIGKLAIWRLQTYDQFNGTWLSDYVPNKFGGFIEKEQSQDHKKPDCPLIGQDGNIFNLMGIASKTLRHNHMATEAKEMCERITSSSSYEEALGIIGEYVNITSIYDEEPSEEMGMEMM